MVGDKVYYWFLDPVTDKPTSIGAASPAWESYDAKHPCVACIWGWPADKCMKYLEECRRSYLFLCMACAKRYGLIW